MINILTLLLLTPAFCESTPSADARALDAIEEACLVQAHGPACEEAYHRERATSDAGEFARVGCEAAKSARSCADLGDWDAKHGRIEAARADYLRACGPAAPTEPADQITSVAPVACHRLIADARRAADALEGEALTAKISQMDEWYRRACASAEPAPAAIGALTGAPTGTAAGVNGTAVATTPDAVATKTDAGAIDPGCEASRVMIGEARRRADQNFGRCALDAEVFGADGKAEPIETLGNSNRLTDLDDRAACATRCRDWTEKFPNGDSSRVQLRTRCLFRGEPLGPTVWRKLNEGRACSAENKIIGTDPRPLYARCHCERQIFDQATATFDQFGVYARGDGTLASNFGGRKWFRCSAAVYWSAPEKSALAPDCAAKVTALRRALLSEPSLRVLVVNYVHLACGRVK